MSDGPIVHLALDQRAMATLGRLLQLGTEADPLTAMATEDLHKIVTAAVVKEMGPERAREQAHLAVEQLREAGAPDEMIEGVEGKIDEIFTAAEAITEDEIENADVDGALDRILSDHDGPEV